MSKGFWIAVVAILVMMILPPVTGNAESPVLVTRSQILDVAKNFHPPSCTNSMTADYCPLTSAYNLRAEIGDLLGQGYTKGQIIKKLTDKYGEQILAAPKKSGFNLLAWMLPGVAVVAGGIFAGYFIRRRVHRQNSLKENVEMDSKASLSAEQQAVIHAEMKNWL